MALDIVTVNVSVVNAAMPNNLQQKSLFLSYGSTTTKVGTVSLLTQLQDYIDLTSANITSLTSESTSSGTMVVTVEYDPTVDFNITGTATIKISGCQPASFNGTYQGSFGSNNFTFSTETYPEGSPSTLGSFSVQDEELINDLTIYFAQPNTVSTYVVEFGFDDVAESELTTFTDFLTSSDDKYYIYKCRDDFDQVPAFISLLKQYEAPNMETYFAINTTDTSGIYSGIKSCIPMVYNTAVGSDNEEQVAGLTSIVASSMPSNLSKLPPFSYRFIYDAAVYTGSNPQKTLLESNNINYVESAAEGGLSNTMVVPGVTADGNDILYWYSVDWTQINAQLQLANAIINGSNNTINPLYYDQDGINRLLLVIRAVALQGQQYGLYNGAPVCTAVPFDQYIAANPTDYAQGLYKGLAMSIVPARGFRRIVFNLTVTIPVAVATAA